MSVRSVSLQKREGIILISFKRQLINLCVLTDLRYTGMLENGNVFDSNVGKKKTSLKFKVGAGASPKQCNRDVTG